MSVTIGGEIRVTEVTTLHRIGVAVVPRSTGQRIQLPARCRLVHIDRPRNGAVDGVDLWYLRPSASSTETATVDLLIVGTGHDVPSGFRYVGTAVMNEYLVWHLFVREV